jgi:hypothetical protein
MFVLNPDPYLLPSYRISPFSTSDITFNNNLPNDNSIEDYLNERFKGHEYYYTINGRSALNLALSSYHLQKDDNVAILTTSGNSYISNCVTTEIEKFCKWSLQIDAGTKLILVNHEFGFPFKGLQELKKKGIPIIEDCAHSFFSKDKDNEIGNIGDFVIYSFPKIFPLQIGGLLLSNISGRIEDHRQIGNEFLRHIKNVLSHHIKLKEKIISERINNYFLLKNKFESLGFAERFHLANGIVPGVFMFRTEGHKIDLPRLRKYFWDHGIQCSVFYGEDAFYIPVHQVLTEQDLGYFYEVMKSFK